MDFFFREYENYYYLKRKKEKRLLYKTIGKFSKRLILYKKKLTIYYIKTTIYENVESHNFHRNFIYCPLPYIYHLL